MPPTLLLIGIGRQRKIPLPLPLVFLWPFAFAAWYGLIAAGLAFGEDRAGSRKLMAARTLLCGFANFTGLKIDVRSHEGSGAYLWII